MDLRDRDLRPMLDRETALTAVFAAGFLVILTVIGFSAAAEISSQQNSFDTGVQVNESDGNLSAGLDTGDDLRFGEMVNGTNMTKTVELSSPELAYLEISSEGNISDGLVYYDELLFVNDTEVPVMYVGRYPGYYEGEVFFDIKTAHNSWGERWLELLYRLPF